MRIDRQFVSQDSHPEGGLTSSRTSPIRVVAFLGGAGSFLLLMLFFRAHEFGVDVPWAIVSLLMVVASFYCFARLLRIATIRHRMLRHTARVALLVALLSHELYYGAQDYLFLREVREGPHSPRNEPRWPPFNSIDIHYYPESGNIFIVD